MPSQTLQTTPSTPVTIMWFRRNLRLQDDPALPAAAAAGAYLPVCVHCNAVAGDWKLGGASRARPHHLQTGVSEAFGGGLWGWFGDLKAERARLCDRVPVAKVAWSSCYEPRCIAQDGGMARVSPTDCIDSKPFSGTLLSGSWEAVKSDGSSRHSIAISIGWRESTASRGFGSQEPASRASSAKVSTQSTTSELAHGYRARNPAGNALAAALLRAPSITHTRATPCAEVGACWEDIDPDVTGVTRKRKQCVLLPDHAVAMLREARPRQERLSVLLPSYGRPRCRHLRGRTSRVAQHQP